VLVESIEERHSVSEATFAAETWISSIFSPADSVSDVAVRPNVLLENAPPGAMPCFGTVLLRAPAILSEPLTCTEPFPAGGI